MRKGTKREKDKKTRWRVLSVYNPVVASAHCFTTHCTV